MLYVIPAKTTSTRVPNKNFREFHEGKSLVDIQIERLLLAGADSQHIWLSCEDPDVAVPVCQRWGIRFHERPESLCDNSVPLTRWIREITRDVLRLTELSMADPGQHDAVAWVQVCDPLFHDHRQVLEKWEQVKGAHDSITVIHPLRRYLLDSGFSPAGGWGFGEWHVPSQRLRRWFQMPFTMSVLSWDAIQATGYHVGARPTWYVSDEDAPHVDIDTQLDWEMAQWLFARQGREFEPICPQL